VFLIIETNSANSFDRMKKPVQPDCAPPIIRR
jgi:hypothetical protein